MKELCNLINEYVLLLKDKPDEESWTTPDLKIAVKSMKTEADGPIPNFKHKLIEMYKKIKYCQDEIILKYNGLCD